MTTGSDIAQSGTITPGHLVAWTTDGVVQDAGTPANPAVTGGLGILSSNQSSISIANAPVNGAYSSLSFGITDASANITLASFGGAPALPFNIIINGTAYPFPGPAGPFLPLAGGTLAGALTLDSTLNMGASTIQWGILPNAEASLPLTAGTGYVAGDVITLTGGGKVAVVSVTGGGVTQFYVQQSGSYTTVPSVPLVQTATTGIGTGFTILPPFGPIAASIGAVGLVNATGGNFVLGFQAGNAMTTSTESTFVGTFSGKLVTTGSFNTGFGHSAMAAETVGSANCAFGEDSMRNTVGITGGTAVGANSYRAWQASFSTALGNGALQGNEAGGTTGANNTAVGYQAMQGLFATTASSNVAVGNGAGQSVTTTTRSVWVGFEAGNAITTGDKSVFVGFLAGSIETTGFENVYIGDTSGALAVGSQLNTFVGVSSAGILTSGSLNAGFGALAGSSITTGLGNLVLGPLVASTTLATGSHNILIGVTAATDTASASTSDTLRIQGNSATAAISGINLNTSTPAITIPGSLATPIVSGVTNLTLGTGVTLATSATTGMIFIPSCNGGPTGNVGALGGVAMIYDATNSKIWIGVAGTWKGVVVS